MSIAVAITNHNQHSMVRDTIEELLSLSYKPDTIFVLSDGKPFKPSRKYPEVIAINNKDVGRCDNRNSVIEIFYKSKIDYLVFLDGDCSIDTKLFLKTYKDLLSLYEYDLVFGMREHSDVSGLDKPPSDFLTANMDKLFTDESLDYRDLRIVSGAYSSWNKAKSFREKLDLILTGMISWSCNFGISRNGLKKLLKFQKSHFNMKGIFDSSCFKNGWGYEDVAMGLDALYAGLNIGISDRVNVFHHAHNRSDGLFDHIRGRHLIMERYRKIERYIKFKDLLYKAAILASAFYTAGLITGMITENITLNSLGM